MRVLENLISDRGSKYAASGGDIPGGPDAARAGVAAFLAQLRKDKKFAKATHHSWGLIASGGGERVLLKGDDGESGAGAVILRMLETAGLENHVVVVTRWYGGTKLGGDRFRHVQEAVRLYLADRAAGG